MNISTTKIVVIHDDLNQKDPLLIVLKEQYGKDNVLLINKSKDGLDYVLNSLPQKMVVILDLKFKAGEPTGVEVFEEIRRVTSLVYVVIMTASDLNSISNDDLIKFINHDALAFLKATDAINVITNKVAEAAHKLDTSVGSVLEQWIMNHSNEQLQEPYITSREGKTYNLNQILQEIRKGSTFGIATERKIINLTIDMFARGKKKVDG